MTIIEKLNGFLSFKKSEIKKLGQVRLCSGRPQKCTVHRIDFESDSDSDVDEFDREYQAKLIGNKKVTATFGNALTFQSSVQVSKEFYRSGAF